VSFCVAVWLCGCVSVCLCVCLCVWFLSYAECERVCAMMCGRVTLYLRFRI
jgi:hypothetical protein